MKRSSRLSLMAVRTAALLVIFSITGLSVVSLFSPREAYAAEDDILSPESIAEMQALEVYSGQPFPSMGIDPGYIDEVGGTQKAGTLPSSYDLRDEGRVTEVKRQGNFGTCWAYSALGSAESILISNGYADSSLNLSEKHLAYFTYNYSPDPLGNTEGDRFDLKNSNYLDYGGTIPYSTTSLAAWKGAVREEDVEGMSIDINDQSQVNQTFDRTLAYSADSFHMTDCLWVAPYDRNAIKRYLMKYGAAQTTLYWLPSYFNYSTSSLYYHGADFGCNHQAVIVGWDDGYSASNFQSPPPSDGAFLCRNTWGTDWGDNGYFWISYCDYCFSDQNTNVVAFNVLEPVGNDCNIYQYDGGSYVSYLFYRSGLTTARSAAVFKAASDGELLKKVEFFTDQANINYSVYIYTGVGDSPNSGKPYFAEPIEGVCESAGFHSVPLPEMIPLSAGETFSIVIKFSTNDKNTGIHLSIDETKKYSDCELISKANPKQTYYSTDGKEWTDASRDGYVMRIKGVTVKLPENELYSLRIKGGTGSARSVSGKHFTGQRVKIKADAEDSDLYKFSHWTTSPSDALVSDRDSDETDLYMPASDTDVAAVWDEVKYSAEIKRLSGKDRFGTSAEISGEGWDSADTVIIASGTNYPDALAASPLAAGYGAPVLLCGGTKLTESVYYEIQRLSPQKAVIIGGTAAVSEDIERQLGDLVPEVERIAGSDRFRTAAMIAARLKNKDECFLVNGRNYPDALSVSAAAAAKGCPILYLEPDGKLPQATKDHILSYSTGKAVIIGGPAAISEKAEDSLAAIGVQSWRIYGGDRYETSLSICSAYADLFTNTELLIATGANYPDALSGAALAAARNMPVLLVSRDKATELGNYITSLDLKTVYVSGGKSAVPSEILYDLFEVGE